LKSASGGSDASLPGAELASWTSQIIGQTPNSQPANTPNRPHGEIVRNNHSYAERLEVPDA